MRGFLARACALACLTPLLARAAPPAPPSGLVVEVEAAGDPTTTESMAERVRALGMRLGVSTRWQSRSRIDARDVLSSPRIDADVLARVWLDLSDPKRAVLYVANASHDRFLVRVVPADDGYGELTQESLTTIVESVVDALAAGGQIGVGREEVTRKIEEDVGVRVEPVPPRPPLTVSPAPHSTAPPRDDVATEPSSPRRGPLRAGLDLSYRVDVVADGLSIRHGPELGLSVTGALSPGVDGLLWVGGHYAPSSTVGDSTGRVHLHGGGGRVAAGVTGRPVSAFAWRALLGGGFDAFDVQPELAPESGWVESDPPAIVVPIATALLGGTFHALSWLEIPFALGLDVDLSRHHFDAASGAERTVLVRPWVAHPFASLGVGLPIAL